MNGQPGIEYLVLRKSTEIGFTPKSADGEYVPDEQLKVESVSAVPEEAAEIAQDDDVAQVALCFPLELVEPMGPDTTDGPDQVDPSPCHTWGLEAVGALDSPYTGQGVKVAVLDTGIDADHPAFDGETKLTCENFTTESGEDLHGHGTHCAGTIFGQPVAGRRIGVAPGVSEALIGKIIPQKATAATTRTLFDGLQWALAKGANVISMSVGIDFPGMVTALQEYYPDRDPRIAVSQALEEYFNTVKACAVLVEYATTLHKFAQPAIVIAAAGNESDRTKRPAIMLGAAPPAVTDGVMAVGAVGPPPGYSVAYFSNRNPVVVAPGIGVTSAKAGGGLSTTSGTSMATPHVAGVAALWAEQLLMTAGSLEPRELIDAVTASATLDGLAERRRKSDVGRGLVQAPQETAG